MDALETALIGRARSALAMIDLPEAEERPTLTWAKLHTLRFAAHNDRPRTGEFNLLATAERLRNPSFVRIAKAEVARVEKGAVATGGTATGSWVSELYSPQRLNPAFASESLRQSWFGQVNYIIAPFDLPLGTVLTSAAPGFVAESAGIPAQLMTTDAVTLKHAKLARILTYSNEFGSNSAAPQIIERDSLRVLVRAIDVNSLDPAVAASGDLPASLTNVLTPITGGSITTPGALDAKLKTAQAQVASAGSDFRDAVWVMNPTLAMAIATLRDTSGATAYAGIGPSGGVLLGTRVVISRDSPSGQVFLCDAGEVFFADEGTVAVDFTKESMYSQDGTGSGTLISAFQEESTGIKLTRSTDWRWRRVFGAVITGLTFA